MDDLQLCTLSGCRDAPDMVAAPELVPGLHISIPYSRLAMLAAESFSGMEDEPAREGLKLTNPLCGTRSL